VIRRVYVKPPIVEKEEIVKKEEFVEKEEIVFVIGGDKELEFEQNKLELIKMTEEEEITKLSMNSGYDDIELEEVYDEKQVSPGNNIMIK